MAEDAIALLDYLGWTNKRDIHVVGASLGGMIAQGAFFSMPYSASLSAIMFRAGDAHSGAHHLINTCCDNSRWWTLVKPPPGMSYLL